MRIQNEEEDEKKPQSTNIKHMCVCVCVLNTIYGAFNFIFYPLSTNFFVLFLNIERIHSNSMDRINWTGRNRKKQKRNGPIFFLLGI